MVKPYFLGEGVVVGGGGGVGGGGEVGVIYSEHFHAS